MSFLSSHLGEDSAPASGPAQGPIDASMVGPDPAVRQLNTVTDVLPTNGPNALATSNAYPVPMTPASPMEAYSPAPLAVVDPGRAQQVAVTATPIADKNKKVMMAVGLGILALAFLAKRK